MATSKLFARFSTDDNKEEAGVWCDFGDGIRVKIRRIRSRKSQEVRKDLERPYQDQVRRGPLPEKLAEELLVNQLANGIISDWEGVDVGDGVEVPYTAANAVTVLTALPELRDEILRISMDADNFRKKVEVDGEKNS